jgi:UrcA family protein
MLTCVAVSAEPQQAKSEDEQGWLTVHAPRVFRQPADGRGEVATNELVGIAHRVNYAGLDLAMHADVLELRKRITESAQNACEQLDVLSPLADLDTARCVREAVEEASVRMNELVAAAIAEYETR